MDSFDLLSFATYWFLGSLWLLSYFVILPSEQIATDKLDKASITHFPLSPVCFLSPVQWTSTFNNGDAWQICAKPNNIPMLQSYDIIIS